MGKMNSLDLDVREQGANWAQAAFFLDAEAVYDEGLRLLQQKHEDYGPKNIAESPGGPINGLRVRIWDKIARINHLVDSGADPRNEALRDSFLDLANYSMIALMVIDETWPGTDWTD
jgi:hypothetical protein